MKTEMKFLIWVILMTLIILSCTTDEELTPEITSETPAPISELKGVETFTFSSNGKDIKGKIYLPDSYKTNKNLPTIYLIDYQESHFAIATDEFDQVIKGVQKIAGLDALVVTLDKLNHNDTTPENFKGYYNLFKDMTSYVDNIYTTNISRTFIGRGSEAGVVLMTLLHESPETSVFDNFIATGSPGYFNSALINKLKNDDFPANIQNKKLHFSYDTADTESNNHQWKELINLIKEKQYPWLKFESVGYQQNFETAYPSAFVDGIKFVFDK